MQNEIKEVTEYLFNCNFFDENFDPEGNEVHQEKAEELQEQYPWNDIIDAWLSYLYEKCHTPKDVINFANLIFYYNGVNNYIPNPYKFLGYLYAKVDMDEYWDEAGDLFDSISIDVLSAQQLVDIVEDPYYNPLTDKNILKEVDNWKK